MAMCVAIPGKVLTKENIGGVEVGKVQFGAITRQVALGFVPEAEVGDYLMVHVGFAISRVEVLPCHQLTPELAEPASIADTVLFIDCAREGQPGELRCEELPPQSGSASWTHDLIPWALLALTSELYGVWPKAYLLSIRGECYEPGDSFSAPVSSHVPELRKMARRLTEEPLATAGSAR
jgi:hydrogenase assembly chaperone HypC/HupF